MDYDSYIQDLASASISLDHAEHTIAEASCDYMNDLAESAYELYDKALQQRCQDQKQIYNSGPQRLQKFSIELFVNNTKINKLDPAKWNSTVQDYSLKQISSGHSENGDKEKKILSSLRAVDQDVNSAFIYQDDLPHGAMPFIPLSN
ncbi:MAG: hypothetical protein Q9228_007962, partial [Teloschistes exilis]